MDNELMNFEDICELYKVDEDTRKVLLRRLKEIGATIEQDNNIIVNMPLFKEIDKMKEMIEGMIKHEQKIKDIKKNEIISWIKAIKENIDIDIKRIDKGFVDDFYLHRVKNGIEEAYKRLNEYKVADEKIKMLQDLDEFG